ncbi:hypothetical protein KFK09_004725 [Dendrobium nobile]|uniref:Uncharacterized protein n=1 Tax=Dendrobium nobile TaxID=94219 RepID=A0A8T3BTV5_DENNO|nr:hypothetical protein KFK09_004725 [Dendrobium nobile]
MKACGAILSNPVPNDTCQLHVVGLLGLPIVKPNTILSPPSMAVDILVGELVFMTIVVTLVLITLHTHDSRSRIVGIIANHLLYRMYASPLSVMCEIHAIWLSFTGFLKGIFWTSYALIKIDIYLLIPNGLGAIWAFFQLLLYAFYYNHNGIEGHENKEENVEMVMCIYYL